MQHQRGFIGAALLGVVVFGIALFAGGAYIALENNPASQTFEQYTDVSTTQTAAVAEAGTSTAPDCVVLTRKLSVGSRGSDVVALQEFLVRRHLLDGANTTGYFGSITQSSVRKWQSDNGIVSSGTAATTGFGVVGVKTRAALAQCAAVSDTTPIAPLQTPVDATCTPADPQTQTLSCASGETGVITQTRTSVCPGPVWSAWQTITNTCQKVTTPTPVPPPAEVYNGNGRALDFLTSDVCVDGADNPIAGDPATCAKHRDLKIGEKVPYQRTDRSWGLFYQSSVSFPTQGPDGSYLIMKVMEFGGSTPASAFRDYDIFAPSIDGYDLHEADGPYVSIIASQDPQAYKPIWAPGCKNDDGWVYWPVTLQKGAEGHQVFQLNYGPSCPPVFAGSLTNWHYYDTPITYTSGKSLESIVSWHYNEADTSKVAAIEVFYNTREYGSTRWEAWNTAGPVEPSGACNGVHEADFFGVHMYLIACHDWTFTSDFAVPLNPLADPMGHDLVFSKNQLIAGDFAQGRSKGWDRINNGTLITSWNAVKDPTTNNYSMQIACMDGCNGNSIYQDVDTSGWNKNITFHYGALLKAAQPAQATITLFLLDSKGAIVGNPQLPVSVGTNAQQADATFDWNFAASPVKTIRYQIYINTPATPYWVDEAYLTPTIKK